MVAVLKPHADFGWHGGYGDMSKAEKKTLIRSHSVVDDDDHSFIDDEETKTVLQIHDAGSGEGGGGIEMVHFDNPMEITPTALSETPPGTWHRWGRGGGEEEVHV